VQGAAGEERPLRRLQRAKHRGRQQQSTHLHAASRTPSGVARWPGRPGSTGTDC
jgi:hypothetical protein